MTAMRTAPVLLRWGALGLAAVTAVVLFPWTWANAGWFALAALGLPVLICLAPVLAAPARYAVVVTWAAAGLLLAWSLLLGLGVGLYLLPAVLVETAAAVTLQGVRTAST
jgi:hypothetical protein